jgi:hypothetical protein
VADEWNGRAGSCIIRAPVWLTGALMMHSALLSSAVSYWVMTLAVLDQADGPPKLLALIR